MRQARSSVLALALLGGASLLGCQGGGGGGGARGAADAGLGQGADADGGMAATVDGAGADGAGEEDVPAPAGDGSFPADGPELPAPDAPRQDAGAESHPAADATVGGRVPADQFSGALNVASFAERRTNWASALAIAGGVVVAVNPDSDSITVVNEATLEVVAEIRVGDDPRTVAVTGDAHYALVVNRGDATVSVVDLSGARELFYFALGPMPYGVVVVGTKAYVTEMARGEVAVLDLVRRAVVARLWLGDSPTGIAACIAPRCAIWGGDSLLVTHLYSGVLSVVDRAALAVTDAVSTGADTNLSQLAALSPDGSRVYLPQTRSNADNPNRQFDTTVFPVVNVVELAPDANGGATGAAATAASPPRLLNGERVTLDTADRPVGMPFAVDLSADGHALWVANAASDDLSVIDLTTHLKLAHIEVGANPRGLLLSADGRRAYVNETLDGTLAVIDTTTFAVATRLPLTHLPLDAQTLLGKKIFHSSRRVDLAKDRWMACATCHFDGLTDGRTWLSFPDGPRNTTALFNLQDTLPLHWSGDLNEVQDVEATIRFIQAGTGLAPVAQLDTLGPPLAGTSSDLDALSSFIAAIPAPPSPYLDDREAMARGQTLFEDLRCATCHAPPRYTDRLSHDVGTGNAAVERNSHGRGTAFDTPSLRALWLTPPYLHDGSAASLEEVLQRGPPHDISAGTHPGARADLITFLLSL